MKITEKITITNECYSELFKRIEDKSVDLVLTDPPYGMDFQSSRRKEKHIKIENDNNLEWLPNWCKDIKRVAKEDSHLYIFCSWHNIDIFKKELEKHFKIKNILIWEKNNHGSGDLQGDYAPKYEMCIFINNGKKLIGGRDSNIIKAKRTNNDLHPTQKPVNLMEYFIEKSTKKGDLVLDTFSGSFPTAEACHNTDRQFKGCEINDKYFNDAVIRLTNHVGQTKLF